MLNPSVFVYRSKPRIKRLTNMHFALVHYPNVDIRLINQIRTKYNPTVEIVITIVFPVPESVGESAGTGGGSSLPEGSRIIRCKEFPLCGTGGE